MSADHPNVTLLQEAHGALERGDPQGFLSLFADDVRWYGTDLNGEPTIMDKAKMLANTAELLSELEESSSTPIDYEAVGDDLVVVKIRARRKAQGDADAVEAVFVTFYRVEGRRITLGGDVAPRVLEDFWKRYRAQKTARQTNTA